MSTKRKRSSLESPIKRQKTEKQKNKQEKKEKEEKLSESEEKPSKNKKTSKSKKTPSKTYGRSVMTPRKFTSPVIVSRQPVQMVTILACGDGSMGQLGLGPDVMQKPYPSVIPELKDIKICDFKTSNMQNAALIVNDKDNTEVWTWGLNDDSAAHVLGRDGEESKPVPVPALQDKEIVQLSVGQYHMSAIDIQGKLYFWGSYKADEFLGPSISKHQQDFVLYPALHPDLTELRFQHVASAANFTVAITVHGDTYEWGWTRKGERPTRNITMRTCLIPTTVMFPPSFKAKYVVCGGLHAIAFLVDPKGNKKIMSWGFNHHGQLGHGDTETRERPAKIEGLPENVIMITCGDYHNLALTEDHKVYAWGRVSYGQCGLGPNTNDITIPTQIQTFDNLPNNDYIVSIGCGCNHSLAITNTGNVYCWGFGEQSQLASGDDKILCVPTLIKGKAFNSVYHCLRAMGGAGHSVFIAKKREAQIISE